MRVTSLDRLGFSRDLADTRLVSRSFYAVIPVIVRENFDADTQSGIDISIEDGTGQIASEWRVYELKSNIREVEVALKTFGQVPPGAQVGDVLLSVHLRDYDALKQVLDEPNAYIVIDKQTFRPESIQVAGVGQIEEWVSVVRAFNPTHRKPGY